jgi:hypothetical protein
LIAGDERHTPSLLFTLSVGVPEKLHDCGTVQIHVPEPRFCSPAAVRPAAVRPIEPPVVSNLKLIL